MPKPLLPPGVKQARALRPKPKDIVGSGTWATISDCNSWRTVHLHKSHDQAKHALKLIDELGCGGNCSGNHQLRDLTA